ncbi:hypothetical protein [Candidatus Spongiihabitans sp.]|uniref:hypothetical protein n=1 Tax=Candidatus Spongiihabitans sp. TaxID=3101308 RepID=UPI003C6F118B
MAWADDVPSTFSLGGLVDFRLRDNQDNSSRLPAKLQRGEPKISAASVTAVVSVEVWEGPLMLVSQVRGRSQSVADRWQAQADVDELYVEYALSDERFLHLSRRNIVFGQAYGVNPLDVFLDPLELDHSLNESRRRREVPGQDMLGFEALYGDVFTVSGYWAPATVALNSDAPQRALLAGEFLLPQWNADFTLLLFEDERRGAGLSWSTTLDDAVLVYGDMTLRQGRDRAGVQADVGVDPCSASPPSGLITHSRDVDRLYSQASVGFSATAESGAMVNFEYYYDANGYSDSEWGEIACLIANNSAKERGGSGNPSAGNLLRIGQLLAPSTLRQHYGFIRAWQPDLFDLGIEAETTLFHGLVDNSGILSLRFEHAESNLLIGVWGSYSYGQGLDEFALRGEGLSGAVYVTVNF